MALATIGAVAGCSAGKPHAEPGSPPPTGAAARDPALQQGRVLYAAHCAQCHGASGQGGTGPSLTGDRLLKDFPTVASQLAFVHKRKIGSALSATELQAVVRYEREVLATG